MTTKRNIFQATLRARETSPSKLGAVLKYLKGQPHYDFKEDIINYLIARYYPHAIKTVFPEEVERNLMVAWEGIGQLEGYIAAIKDAYGIDSSLAVSAPTSAGYTGSQTNQQKATTPSASSDRLAEGQSLFG